MSDLPTNTSTSAVHFPHPIYRYLWPTPQSIFYPVSHRIPSLLALSAQLYSAALFRYVHIDPQSNLMRERAQKSIQSSLTTSTALLSSSSSTTSSPSPSHLSTPQPITPHSKTVPTKPTNSSKTNQSFQFVPSPQFPHQALIPLLFFHLSLLRFPTAANIDFDSYKSQIDQPWSLTKVYSPVPLPNSKNDLISSSIIDIVDQQVHAIEQDTQLTISQNNPSSIGPIPHNHREQLHQRYFSVPNNRIIYPLLDEHRTPLPLFETEYLRSNSSSELSSLSPPTNSNITHSISPPSASNQLDQSESDQNIKTMLESVHSILKQHLPVKDSDQTSTTESKLQSNNGSRSIALKQIDIDNLAHSSSTTKLSDSRITINTPFPSPNVNRSIRLAHPKTKSKLLKTSPYRIFGSKLLLERYIAKLSIQSNSQIDHNNIIPQITPTTSIAKAFMDLFQSSNLQDPRLLQLLVPSYHSFEQTDAFSPLQCVIDSNTNSISTTTSGDTSITTTSPTFHEAALSPTQLTPSSVVISCSPEKQEVWGTLMFALSILNTHSLQHRNQQHSLNHQHSQFLPPINPIQPNTIKVESMILQLLHRHYHHAPIPPTDDFLKDYSRLSTHLATAPSFYDSSIYSFLINGLQSPTNTLYIPTQADIDNILTLHQHVEQLRSNNSFTFATQTDLFNYFDNTFPNIPPSTKQLYFNTLTHSIPYPLSNTPTSPQFFYHISFDTDSSPYCFVPKAVQGILSPTSVRPTLAEHQQLMFARSFKRKNLVTIDSSTSTPNSTQTTTSTTPSSLPNSSINHQQPTISAAIASTVQSSSTQSTTYPNLPYGDLSFNLLWTWRHSTINHQYLHIFQKVNHFQRSGHLTRKDALSKNISRSLKALQQHELILKSTEKRSNKAAPNAVQSYSHQLDILPRSYVFPLDLQQFKNEYRSRQNRCEQCHGIGQLPQSDPNAPETQTIPCTCQLWIVKPVNSSRGRGIFITSDVTSFSQPYFDFYDGIPLSQLYGAKPIQSKVAEQQQSDDQTINNNDKVFNFAETTDYPPVVVQHYINNPLLLHKRKFDLRLYVLVVSFEPLEAYIYNEGYARFAGSEFSSDITNLHGHLTNSSINLEVVQSTASECSTTTTTTSTPPTPPPPPPPTTTTTTTDSTTLSSFSTEFHDTHSVPRPSFAPSVLEMSPGSSSATFDNCKQLFSEWLLDMMQTFGDHPTKPINAFQLLQDIDRVILNSLLIVAPRIGPQSNAFELFGYDIMIDDNYRPWLLEVNSSPSLNLNTDIDTIVKPQLLADTISLLGLLPYDRSILSQVVQDLSKNHPNKDSITPVAPSSFVRTAPGFSGGTMLIDGAEKAQNRHSKNDTPIAADDVSQSSSVSSSHFCSDPINHTFSNLLSNYRPRLYGELPVNIGNYRRLSPNGPGSVFSQQSSIIKALKRLHNKPL